MATKKAVKKAPAKKAAAKKTTTQKVPAKKSAAKKAPVKIAAPKSGAGGAFKSRDKATPQPMPDLTNNQAKTAQKAADKNDQYIRS